MLMEKLINILKLMRWWQWYKNLLVFIAIFFAGALLNVHLFVKSMLAFLSLCFISSANYTINDITDVEEDRKHPEKKKRPIASGVIKEWEAYVIAAVLITLSFVLASMVSCKFFMFPLALFLSTTFYSYFLKNVPLVDIHIIGFNFVLRAAAGAYAIGKEVSPWLVVVVFFIALFLAVGKRKGDYVVSRGKSKKKIYSVYTPTLMDSLLTVLAACLLMSYSIYTFNSPAGAKMMFTIPLASFLIFRYYHLAEMGAKAGRRVEYLFRDFQWMSAFILWVLICFLILYVG